MKMARAREQNGNDSQTVLIAVSTNLDTRFVVIPLRSETVADLRARMKTGHMAVFPDLGEVDTISVQVELFGWKFLLQDTQSIGQIFMESPAAVYAELTKLSWSSRKTSPLSRSNLFGRTELSIVPARDVQQCVRRPAPSLETLADVEERDRHLRGQKEVSEEEVAVAFARTNCIAVAPDHANIAMIVADQVTCGGSRGDCSVEARRVHRSVGKETELREGMNVDGVGLLVANLDGVEEFLERVSKKSRIDRPRPGAGEVADEPDVLTPKPKAVDKVMKASAAVKLSQESSSTDGSSDSSKYEERNNSRKDKVQTLTGSVPIKKDLSDDKQQLYALSKRTGSHNKACDLKRNENNLDTGPHLPGSARKSLSGSTTCESSGHSIDSRRNIPMDLQKKSKNDTINGGRTMKRISEVSRQAGDSRGRYLDQETLKTKASLLSIGQSETDQSSSSDGSEEVQPRVSHRAGFFSPLYGGAVRRNSEKAVDLKYKHLIDSQYGFDELINLSQQKPKVDLSDQKERVLQESVAPVTLEYDSLENDGLSIDLVLDTQVENLNGRSGYEDAQRTITATKPLEENNRQIICSEGMECVNVKEECISTHPSEGGLVSKSVSVMLTSQKDIETLESDTVKLESITTIRSIPKSSEQPSHIRPVDSQQLQAAVQLTMMSMVEDGEINSLDNVPNKKKKRKKQGTSSHVEHSVIRESSVADATRQQNTHCLEKEEVESPVRHLAALAHRESLQTVCIPLHTTMGTSGDGVDHLLPLSMHKGEEATARQEGDVVNKDNIDDLKDELPLNALFGRKKSGKRKQKVVPGSEKGTNGVATLQQDIGEHHEKTRGDKPPGLCSDLPKISSEELDCEEGKTPPFEYRDLRTNAKIGQLTTPKKNSGQKKGKGKKLLQEAVEGAVEFVTNEISEAVHAGPENTISRLSEDEKSSRQLGRRKLQVEIKVKDNEGEFIFPQNKIEPPVVIKSKDPTSRRELGNVDFAEGNPPTTEVELAKPQERTEIPSIETPKKKTRKEKRVPGSVKSTEKTTTVEQALSNDAKARQDHKENNSTFIHQKEAHLVSDKSLLEKQIMQEELGGKDHLLVSGEEQRNVDEDAQMKSQALGSDEKKQPSSENSRKKVSKLEIPDIKANGEQREEGGTILVGGVFGLISERVLSPEVSTKETKTPKFGEDFVSQKGQQRSILSMNGAEPMPSSIRDKLVARVLKARRLGVAEERRQLQNLTVRNESAAQSDLSGKKKRRKGYDVNLKPVEDGNGGGAEPQSFERASHRPEDEVKPQCPVKNIMISPPLIEEVKGGDDSSRKPKKRSRKTNVAEEISLDKDGPGVLQTKKDFGSGIGHLLLQSNLDKSVVKAGSERVKSRANKKGKVSVTLEAAEMTPI